MTTHKDEAVPVPFLRRLGKVHDLRHVREIIARKSDDVRVPFRHHPVKVALPLHLQIKYTHFMACATRRLGDQFKPNGSRRR